MQPVVKCNWYPRQFAGGHFEPGSIWPGSGCCLLRLNTIGGRPGRLGCTICTGALFAWVHFLHGCTFCTRRGMHASSRTFRRGQGLHRNRGRYCIAYSCLPPSFCAAGVLHAGDGIPAQLIKSDRFVSLVILRGLSGSLFCTRLLCSRSRLATGSRIMGL